MTTLTTEQAQQIEEALEDIVRVFEFETGTPVEALATIRTARAQEQSEQEPVAANCPKCKSEISHWSWCPDFVQPVSQKQEPVAVISESAIGLVKLHSNGVSLPFGTPLYAAPVSAKREWVELTDDEVDLIEQQVYCRTTQKGRPLGVYAVELIRALIAAFKEKNK